MAAATRGRRLSADEPAQFFLLHAHRRTCRACRRGARGARVRGGGSGTHECLPHLLALPWRRLGLCVCVDDDVLTMEFVDTTHPFGTSWRKVMMWWFIVTDGLLFAGFLASYGYARLLAFAWPDQSTVF